MTQHMKKVNQSQGEVQTIDASLKMVHSLELWGKDFKIIITNILSEVKENTHNEWGKLQQKSRKLNK